MEKSKLERENDRNDIALFKYGIIAPLINNIHTCKSNAEFYREAANKKYALPNGKEATFSPATIKKWHIKYQKYGFDILKTKSRSDFGISRKIPIGYVDKIEEIKKQFPHITGKAIYRKLVEDGDISACNVSLASLYRFLNSNHLHTHETVERKAFEMEFANDCWQR